MNFQRSTPRAKRPLKKFSMSCRPQNNRPILGFGYRNSPKFRIRGQSMSYCRWSSDKFRSDVYVYACFDNTWTTHVALSKLMEEYPGPDPYSLEEIQKP